MFFSFTFRHLLRHWRMNLVLFVALLLTAVFLSALPLYANAIAGRNLTQTLQDAPTDGKNMLVQGAGLNAGLHGTMQDIMGNLLRDRVEVREGQMGGQWIVIIPLILEKNP